MTQKTNPARERFEEALAELSGSDEWRRWLDTRARFHRYSFGNVLLIAFQRPDATRVAGFRAWQGMGRHVQRGEKGIAILAPVRVKVRDENGTPDEDAERIVRFRTVYVFDVAQTASCSCSDCEGGEYAEAPLRVLDGDSGLTDLADALAGHAMAEGLDVARRAIAGGALGQLRREEREIVVEAGLGRDAALKTLIHELAHWHDLGADGVYDAHSRPDAEIVAESVAYVVASAYGLDTSGYSLGYVAEWAGGDVEKVKALAERVDRAAGALLSALDADLGVDQQEEAA